MSGEPSARAEDQELLRRCADGEDDAWSELLRRYGAFFDYMVRRALVASRGGRLANPTEVEEIRDEIITWLLENDGRVLRTYRGESKLTSWMGVVIGRRARRIARRGEGLRSKTVSLDALTADAASHLAIEEREDATPRQVALQKLGEALATLSERDRALLQGAFYEKRSYADLADDLGVRTDSIGQLLFRAKKRLKKNLGGMEFLETLSGLALVCLLWLLEGPG